MLNAATILDTALLRTVIAALATTQPEIEPQTRKTGEIDWNLPGFGGKVRVETTFGSLPIEALRVRDEIRTASGSVVSVQWIDKVHLDEDFIRKHPSARPVRIWANSFGAGKPKQDILVSPGQDVCPDAHVVSHFSRAKDLDARFNALRAQSSGLTYYRFHCGEPVVVQVEGVWVRVQGPA